MGGSRLLACSNGHRPVAEPEAPGTPLTRPQVLMKARTVHGLSTTLPLGNCSNGPGLGWDLLRFLPKKSLVTASGEPVGVLVANTRDPRLAEQGGGDHGRRGLLQLRAEVQIENELAHPAG